MMTVYSSYHEKASSFRSKEEVLNAFLKDLCFWEELGPSNRSTDNSTSSIRERERQPQTAGAEKCRAENSSETRSQHTVWKAAVDPVTGRTYYYDNISRMTQWEKVCYRFREY